MAKHAFIPVLINNKCCSNYDEIPSQEIVAKKVLFSNNHTIK